MGYCTIGRAKIAPETTTDEAKNIAEKYSNWVYQTTSNDSVAAIIVNAINTGKFIEHFKNNDASNKFAKNSIFEMDGNEFKGAVKEYEQEEIPSVMAFAMKGQGENKDGFDSIDTRTLALNYTGDIMIDVYNELAYKLNTTKVRGDDNAKYVKFVTQNRIVKELVDRAITYCDQHNLTDTKEELRTQMKLLAASVKSYINNSKRLTLPGKEDKKNEFVENIKEASANRILAIEQILGISTNLFNSDLNENRNRNYTALAAAVTTNPQWFVDVSGLPKTFNIRDLIKPRAEKDKVNDIENYDDYSLNSILSEEDLATIDSSTASWNDANYNNFIQHFDGRIKLYLSGLYKLRNTTKVDDKYNYATENALGVKETMGAGYVISQLITFGKYTSVNDFIKSVEDIANNISECAGLIKMVDDMKANRSFANMVASNLAKPTILKNIIRFDGEAFNIIHSNQNAYTSTQIFNRLKAVSAITISQEYDPDATLDAAKYLKQISDLKDIDFVNSRLEIGDFVLNYFEKNFPGINPDVIAEYYYTTKDGEKVKRAKELLGIIKEYNEKAIKIKEDINKELKRVNDQNTAFKKHLAASIGVSDYSGIPLSEDQLTTFDYDRINYKAIDSAIAKLSTILSKNMPSFSDLNSGNAENNMSSDIIKNSYLTNFLSQLNDILESKDGNENERGLKLLKEFYGKVGQNKQAGHFDYSPILFGIKSGNTYLREGLFIKQPNGTITINKNAKELINIILFNGIKNTNLRTGQLYQNMSSSDYFTSIITSYFNPINYNYNYKDDISKYCQVLLRIPSDASNQYAVQMPKYKYDDFYKYKEDVTKQYINEKLVNPYVSLKGKEHNFTKQVTAVIKNEAKLNVVFDNKKGNFIEVEEATKILNDGKIEGVLNLFKYKTLNNGKVLPLLVKDNKGTNSFIIYLTSDNATYKSGTDYKVTKISPVDGVEVKVYDDLLNDTFTEIKTASIEDTLHNYFISNISFVNEFAFAQGIGLRQYNRDSAICQGFIAHIKNDLNRMVNAIFDVFEPITDENGIVHYVTKQNTTNLFEYYHFDPKEGIVKDGKLTGKIFGINTLFNIDNYDVKDKIEQVLSFYGNDGLFVPYKDGRLELNLKRTDIITENLGVNIDGALSKLMPIIPEWLNEYTKYITRESAKFEFALQKYSQNQIQEAILNQTLAYMDFDDLFEGSSCFYEDAQTFLKRDKEIQAGGQAYMGGIDTSISIGTPIEKLNDDTGKPLEIKILKKDGSKGTVSAKNYDGGNTLFARTGFRATTIANTVTTFDSASEIYNKVYKQLTEVEHKSPESAKVIAKSIADGYGYSGSTTKVNDAQSYITLEEFIRRKWMDGTIDEYGDLLDKLLDENYKLTPEDYANINHKIQVQKNFYYDVMFDTNTGLYYPRQIKNAEFVLIPRFIKGSELEQLYNIMKENDINQINTVETSKAANINTLEFWDNDGKIVYIKDENGDYIKDDKGNKIPKLVKDIEKIPESIQTYYYRYLYKQQDIVDHIDNEENKAGIQILKKIQDNVVPGTKAWDAAKTIQDLLVENIKSDYDALIESCGWKVDDKGNIINKNGTEELNFDEFYKKARNEAARLGMDSNFLDYITPDSSGRPKMPTFMNNVSNKLESIAQSVFNTSIIRQTLPGFHAVQVTNVGYSRKLNYKITDEGIVAQIMIAPWNDEIKTIIDKYGKSEAIKQLQIIEADEFIGYRIPTEGKQSIVKLEIVDFLDESQGSTIIVPNEWVAQSGSDFDIDTIYSIVHELKITSEIVGTDSSKRYKRYYLDIKDKGRSGRNNKILEAFKTILSDPSCFEENASRSNYDDLSNSKKRYNIDKNITTSVYDPITQVRFMQNAIDGRKLKAFSVNRDTFLSISNRVHGIIKRPIIVKYDLSKGLITEENLYAAYGKNNVDIKDNIATVTHNKIGWSNNNRNVVGKLITPYSSQTTAHILDAIKKGTLFNETDYTFGCFKTLIDLGIDYDTAVSFLYQGAISDLNTEYFKVNSAFTNSFKTVIENVYREFAKRAKLTLDGQAIKDTATIEDVIKAVSQDEEFKQQYIKYWELNNIDEIPAFDESKFANNINDKSNLYHYFGILQMFNNLKQITDVIEDVAQVSRPDATGARQTVRATRKLLNNAKEYASDKAHSILTDDEDNSFLNSLYGFDENGNVHIEKSKYKYLAAMFKYGVETSVTVNKQLFATASDKFNNFIQNFEVHIGRDLTDDEYNYFKKYYVSSLYNALELISSPIKLNETNNIIPEPNYAKYGPNYWDTEKSRIAGYIEPNPNGDSFTVKDFRNPTPEEIEQYNLLTPLQKVLFLKKVLPYDDNIFNKLYINKIGDKNYKEKGYTNNKISINIGNYNIETLYQQFANALFSYNKFIRLAAIDLIKYSFIVEGYDYKNGAISKIIPNSAIYNEINEYGLNLITTLNNRFYIQLEKNEYYYDRFIRSHSDIISPINIPSPAAESKPSTIGNILNNYREKIKVLTKENTIDEEYSGLIQIPVSSETQDLLKYLKLSDADRTFRYIRINSSIASNKKKEVVLYKVIPEKAPTADGKNEHVTKFNLIPLNLLDEQEWSDESINYNNNKFYPYSFYGALHNDIVNPNNFILPRYRRTVSSVGNTSSIEDLVAKPESASHELAVRARNQILDWYNNRRNLDGGKHYGYIQLKGVLVNSVLGIDAKNNVKTSTQNIIIDDLGTVLTVELTRVSNYTKDPVKTIRKIKNGYPNRATDYLKWFAQDNDNFYYSPVDSEDLGLFKVVPITVIEKAEPSTQEQFSAFSGLVDHINTMTNGIKHTYETTDMSALVMKELQYQKAHGDKGVADELKLLSIKGFVPNDSTSLEEYKVDIYKIAAKYYRDKADKILEKLKHFSCNDEVYDVSEDALYEAMRDDPDKANELYRLILEASTFGNQIPGILDLQFIGEDKETTDNLARIQRAINDVKNSTRIHKAFNNIYNIYLAKEYAVNPNVRLGIVAMTDIFGDSDWFSANIGDVTHLNHKQIQVVTKLAMQELEKARIRGIREVSEFNEFWNKMEQKFGSDNMQKVLDKLIDSKGVFIQPYNNKFIEDAELLKEEVDAAKKYGKTSIEYLKAKHKRDKWYIDNTEEPYTKDYYQERWNNEDHILKTEPEKYSEYLTLEQEYYGLGKYATLTDEQKERKRILAEKMQDMREDEILNGFLTNRSDINNKYFEWVASDDFKKAVEKNKKILEDYHQNNPTLTMWDMYNDPDVKFDRYRDAYDWIKTNCVYTFDDKAKEQIYNAFKVLKRSDDRVKRGIVKILNKIDPNERYDAAGQIIGTKYSIDDSREIKRITEQKYNPYGTIDESGELKQTPYNENSEAYDSDANLIKIVPETPIFTEEFFIKYFLSDEERNTETRNLKRKYYTFINDIVKKGLALDEAGNRILSAELLVKNCSLDELKQLANAYRELRLISKKATEEYNKDNNDNKEDDDKKPFTYKTNVAAVLEQKKFIDNTTKEVKSVLEDIFYERKKDGTILYNHKIPVGNKYLYGYVDLKKDAFKKYIPEAEKYIDQKKTDARNLIDNNIEFAPTEYYYKAKADAKAKGDEYYKEWYEANHVYNPYKHEDEPITIWTTMKAKPSGTLNANVDYVANRDNLQRIPREKYKAINELGETVEKSVKNPKYSEEGGVQYNGSAEYANPVYNNLTDDEKYFLEKLQKYARTYAITQSQNAFLNKGFAPRVYEKESDFVDTLNDIGNIFGIGRNSYMNKEWHPIVDFEHDFDASFSMFQLLKTKGYQQILEKPVQSPVDAPIGESKEQYQKRLDDWKKLVKKIKADNLALDNAVLSRNWKDVYTRLIKEGNVYAAKARMKDLLYLTLEDLRERPAYALTSRKHLFGDIIKNRSISTVQKEGYYTTEQTQTIDTFQNWIRRYLFDEYKNYTKGTKIADRIQTMNSAKFMMFNLMSGINNINVGWVNMRMEGIAGEYFTYKQITRAMFDYLQHSPSIVNHFLTGEVTSETVALMDLFNIEGYDKNQRAFQDIKSKSVEKFNDVAYGFLSSGEHFMQNAAMLAMLESHKIYKDPSSEKEKYVVGTEYDYLLGIEIAALEETLKDLTKQSGDDATFYRDLHYLFHNVYLKRIKENKREGMKFDRNQKDIVNDFVRAEVFRAETKSQTIARRKTFIDAYVARKKALIEKAKKDFNAFPTVKSQLYFDKNTGEEKIRDNSHLTDAHIAEIINKTKSVNKKIHGVYDKMGAAKIERSTLGGLIMQYKKHLYPGFMKHWRRRGYFNEHRGTYEYGSVQSLLDFITTDFRYKSSINDKWADNVAESSEEVTQKSVVSLAHLFVNNALDLGINWKLLPDWQKQNIARLASDIGSAMVALLVIMAIYSMMSDDDLKESRWANEMLYLADRLYGEATMYDIGLFNAGLWTEFSNFKDKPIVAMDYIYDGYKMLDYIKQWATNPDYEPNYKRGTYKGENKMGIILRKNIPGYRQWNQFKHIASHNNYYRVNESNTMQTLFKNLGNNMKGTNENADKNPIGLINR